MSIINVCVILLLVGLLLLVVEMFIPGFGVCGITGIVLLIVSAVLAVLHVPYGLIFVGLEVAVIALIIYLTVVFMKRRQLHGHLIMKDTLNEDAPSAFDLKGFVGREGVVKTVLKPSGEVDFNGVIMEALSEGQYLEKGAKVKVRDICDNKLIVRQVN